MSSWSRLTVGHFSISHWTLAESVSRSFGEFYLCCCVVAVLEVVLGAWHDVSDVLALFDQWRDAIDTLVMWICIPPKPWRRLLGAVAAPNFDTIKVVHVVQEDWWWFRPTLHYSLLKL